MCTYIHIHIYKYKPLILDLLLVQLLLGRMNNHTAQDRSLCIHYYDDYDDDYNVIMMTMIIIMMMTIMMMIIMMKMIMMVIIMMTMIIMIMMIMMI
jgi:hypothetical protein